MVKKKKKKSVLPKKISAPIPIPKLSADTIYRYRNSVDTTLRGKRINNFVKLWCLVASGQPANANETQMSKPPDANKHHNSTKLLSLLLLRAIYFSRFQYKTPCVIIYPVTSFFTLVTPSQAS